MHKMFMMNIKIKHKKLWTPSSSLEIIINDTFAFKVCSNESELTDKRETARLK